MRAFVVLCAVVGCQASPRAVHPVASVPPASSSTAVTKVFVPSRTGSILAIVDPDGTSHLVVGTLRVDLTGTSTWASDELGSHIAAVAPVANGAWVFVGEDGTVARSVGFTGKLERLGEIPRGVRFGDVQNGRVVVVDELGRAWETDGTYPIRRMKTPEGSVTDAAFADARRGAVVMDGGTLWLTDDAGQSWTRVDHDDLAVVSLTRYIDSSRPADFVLRAATTDGGREIFRTERGAPVAKGGVDVEVMFQRTWPARRQQARMRAGDPHAYRVVKGVVERRDYESGKLLASSAPLGGSDCQLVPWGPKLIATCTTPQMKAWSSDSGLTFVPVELPNKSDVREIRWSDDGVHAAVRGACGADAPTVAPTQQAVCVRRADGWHTLVVERGDPYRAHGRWVRISDGVLDVETGVWTEVPHKKHVATAGFISQYIRQYEWTSNGALIVIADDREASHSWLIKGPPTGPVTSHRLPILAHSVAFADDMRGIVVGETLDDVWRTTDGGTLWERVKPPIDGNPARIKVERSGGYWKPMESVQCRETGCWIADVLVLDGWGPMVSGPTMMLAQRPTLSWNANDSILSSGSYGILVEGTSSCTAGAKLPPQSPRRDGTKRVQHVYGPQGVAIVGVAPGGVLEVSWQSGNKKARASASIPEFAGDDAEDSPATYMSRAMTSAGILLERCPAAVLQDCTVLWGTNGGVIEPIRALAGSILTKGHMLTVASAVPRKDGGVIALLSTGVGRDGFTSVIASIDPRGEARLRWFAWGRAFNQDSYSDSTRRVLGRYRGELGLVFADVLDPNWLRFIPLEKNLMAEAINLPWVVQERYVNWNRTRCDQFKPSADDLEVFEVSELHGKEMEQFGPAMIRGRVSPAGICTLEARSWARGEWFEAIHIPGGDLRATGDGTLSGSWTSASGTRALTCKDTPK